MHSRFAGKYGNQVALRQLSKNTGYSLDEIARLAAGCLDTATTPKADFIRGMEALAQSIDEHARELMALWAKQDDPEFLRLAPTCTRLLLEQCLATILGRLDPIRLVTIVRGSKSPDFNIGARNNSSFSWSEDVLPNYKPGSNPLWSQGALKSPPCRGVLDGHLGDYLFGSHHDTVLDSVQTSVTDINPLPGWLISFLKHEDGKQCLTEVRKRASECYSGLSKGLHFEFFKDHATKPQKEEIISSIKDAILVISTCALYSHFTDISLLQINRKEATNCFVNLIKTFECQ